jgi:hypothetical protein
MEQSGVKSSFINMLLEDFVSLTNLTAVFALNEPTDRKMLARILASVVILLLGADALTPTIIRTVWGSSSTQFRWTARRSSHHPVLRTTSFTSGSTPPSMATSSSHLTP